ncbi:MAG: hypothetical protein MI685_06975 [Chlorobiales bacterium]|nr:hypothetical protein [Chlorobiales bacterium]
MERLLDNGYLKFMIWAPQIYHGGGMMKKDGKIDESVIYGMPPFIVAPLPKEDLIPEKNILNALNKFNFNKDRKKIFIKRTISNYIVPNESKFMNDSIDIILDAYASNNLVNLGLPYDRAPDQLHMEERKLLVNLSNTVIETALLAKYNLKGYLNFEHYEIFKQNLNNIGRAFNVTENTNTLFKLEGLPRLKELFLHEKMNFDSIFNIRQLSLSKYFRNWINKIDKDSDAKEITKEYLNEIKGNTRFFETTEGKFLKNLGLFGANTAIGAAVAGPIGIVGGYVLGLLETFWLDNILNGQNPSMFIDYIKQEINHDEK